MKITGTQVPDKIRLIGFVTRPYAGRAANSGAPRSISALEGEVGRVHGARGGGGEFLPLRHAKRVAAAQVGEGFVVVKIGVARELDVVGHHRALHRAVARSEERRV